MIGLLDCNNFFASCERVFNPSLNNKPVVVLSNNDGCVIARSNEAKAIGIKMGVPAFEIEELIIKNKVTVFSSNYTLYGDMSQRVMNSLKQFISEIEIYSIDEAFLHFEGFKNFSLPDYAKNIVKTITRSTGIPISLGIAPTKTLAKVASKIVKKNPEYKGVFIMPSKNETEEILKNIAIEDVWGIGRQYSAFLKKNKIHTAFDFIKTNKEWIKKNLTVVGLRTWNELQGIPCFEMETSPADKKAICTARSFGKMLTDYEPIEEAVSNHAAACAVKLRKQKSCAKALMIFIHTNQHRNDLQQYAKNIVVEMPVATNSTIEIIKYASEGLKAIFKKGYHYKKAGVIAVNIIPENAVQGNIFDETDRTKHKKLMQTIDRINAAMGTNKVIIAKQGTKRKWKLRQEKLSPCYTTKISDIITVKT
ncbi:MAG: Y-family DNA polymerase [Bacteroidales bacterium]|nr:Y-family DNA polymerase [Bacteroidales bacterium]